MTVKEEKITPIITNLLKTVRGYGNIKEDLFQELYLYHLELEKRYSPSFNVPIEAFMIKFLKWRMWTLVKKESASIIQVSEYFPDYREEEEEVNLSPLIEGFVSVTEAEAALLILRHIGNKSYQELALHTGMCVEGIRKKLTKIEQRIKWEGTKTKTKRIDG